MREQKSQSQKEFYCKPCSKRFKSKAKLEDHERSKKHRKNLKKWDQNKKSESQKLEVVTSENLANRCLFCHFKGSDFQSSFEHMKKEHSFFVLGKIFWFSDFYINLQMSLTVWRNRKWSSNFSRNRSTCRDFASFVVRLYFFKQKYWIMIVKMRWNESFIGIVFG